MSCMGVVGAIRHKSIASPNHYSQLHKTYACVVSWISVLPLIALLRKMLGRRLTIM
jgi:hypothetical protein